VSVTTNRGLGRATANVYRRLSLAVSQSYGANPKPTINVYPGGGIYLQDGNASKTIASDIPVFMRGGAWSSSSPIGQWYNNCTQSGPVTLVSNTVVGCANYGVVWTFTGPIDGPGQFIYQSPGDGAYGIGTTYLSGTNTYAGGTWVQSGLLVAKNTNAFGSGAVQVDYNTNAASHGLIQLAATTPSSNYWTLANNLVGGCGTNVAMQVENGASTNTLTLLGAVDPGTNGTAVTTNSTGIYRIDGSVAFGAGSRLRIHIADTNGVAGVDFDRLLVDHDLTGLGNATLEVAVSSSLTPEMLNGLSFVVVSNATALVGTFGSVEWSGPWQGKVVYNQPTGTVKLTGSDSGSVYKFR
jgi:autotransporter-associated beta strand protein